MALGEHSVAIGYQAGYADRSDPVTEISDYKPGKPILVLYLKTGTQSEAKLRSYVNEWRNQLKGFEQDYNVLIIPQANNDSRIEILDPAKGRIHPIQGDTEPSLQQVLPWK